MENRWRESILWKTGGGLFFLKINLFQPILEVGHKKSSVKILFSHDPAYFLVYKELKMLPYNSTSKDLKPLDIHQDESQSP